MKPNNAAFQAVVALPAFALGIRCDADWVTAIEFLPAQTEQTPATPLAAEAVRQLRAWRDDPRFVFGLPLKPAGTLFQRRVWTAIAAIPFGETRTYGEVAKSLRNAPRAVGQACGANPYPVVVPCHRVVAAGGGLGGFGKQDNGAALDVKRWLLAHERQT